VAQPAASPASGKRPVTVIVDHEHVEHQPATFQLCPLGLQFYSPRALEEFAVLELDINVPAAHGRSERITCTGAVVRCQYDKEHDRHRVWLKFIDLPDAARERIHCASKDGQHLCSYCENF
jgi:hypothetical protein